jgi:HlyD family secretion protein
MTETQLPADPRRTDLARPMAAGPAQPADPGTDRAGLARSLRRPILLGCATIAIFIGGFGVFAGAVPLAGGAVAPGVISPDGSRKKVQHFEGGIVGEILVRDGDRVEAGQPVIVLEETQARANYQMQLGQHRTLLASYARLQAEQLMLPRVTFPEELMHPRDNDLELQKIVDGQQRLFETRSTMHESRKKVLRQRIEQLGEQIRGLQAQVDSATDQIGIIDEELVGKHSLLKKELINKPEVLRLERERAEILGDRGEYEASIARAKQQIGETELQLLAADAERADDIAKTIDEVRAQLAEVSEKLFASADVLKRTTIPAPVSGTVVNLAFKTRGGVVKPGETMLEVVPLDDDLLIDAQLSPTDIDVVHPGMPAQVHLSAFSSRIMPRIDGVVRTVSADRLVDERTGHPYFLARIEVDRDAIKEKVGPEIELVPGMPAEVLIVTGERTTFHYLAQPFIDAFRRAMRES